MDSFDYFMQHLFFYLLAIFLNLLLGNILKIIFL